MAAPMATRTTAITNTSDICTDRSRMQPATGMTARLWSPVAAGDAIHEALHGLEGAGDQDAHQLAHANAIRRRFTNRNVSNWQIAFFGLTGGLIPCPAAVTVLLLCLQLKEITLGAVLVLCFSIGLAITLVTVGAVAALGARQVSRVFLDQRSGTAGALPFKPADHRGWHLRGYSWLAWADQR